MRPSCGDARMQGNWTDEDLSVVILRVQLNIWRSVVKVLSKDMFSRTALAVDRTTTHFYLLTNLLVWIDEDKTFINH